VDGSAKLEMQVDKGKLEQILINLIGNSIKFTIQGSVTVKLAQQDNQVVIKIVDTGEGIPLQNQSLLFHKFQQAGPSIMTRDGAKGTGLGLYISRLMAEGMGGKLQLDKSEPGKGSI
jgi:protein-histidine pros-kinase